MIPDNEMLESELRKALRRESAPPDFAAKILAKTTVAKPVEMPRRPIRRPFTLGLAAALAALTIVPAAVMDYRRREEARGMKAKQDLLTALSITHEQLRQARDRIQRSTKQIQ